MSRKVVLRFSDSTSCEYDLSIVEFHPERRITVKPYREELPFVIYVDDPIVLDIDKRLHEDCFLLS